MRFPMRMLKKLTASVSTVKTFSHHKPTRNGIYLSLFVILRLCNHNRENVIMVAVLEPSRLSTASSSIQWKDREMVATPSTAFFSQPTAIRVGKRHVVEANADR